MRKLPRHIEQRFYDTIFGSVALSEFESWVYTDKEIESILSDDEYLELLSFNYKKSGAKYELVNLLTDNYIDLGEYEKWKMLNLLYAAKDKDKRLPNILRQLYDLYCKGYDFLNDLGLGYGLTVEVPPSKYKAETWEEMTEIEKKELIESFYPQLQSDIERAITWIEDGKIILSGNTDEMGHHEYEDLRTEEEKKSTVWTEVERDDKTGWSVEDSNLKILKEENRPTTMYKNDGGDTADLKSKTSLRLWSKLKSLWQ
ncbi:hypothetical protein [Pontibacter akesuensis]|uniref:Uncharacterized protein n=1 Tax=Pontibacter akesuensis TaxID=388950 RepID=A0A1I7IFQ2_9BACT|nr:hypothetical protein [Pontibacter akesuensis]GHA66965.1 hypothetical protein GCM10007389_20080 [Pontibacter akesuensis]SFU71706.1 hypothetical protein SAMN04487941_2178 [Pontibacter akesuensis]